MKALGQIEGYAAIVEWLSRKFYRLAAAKLMPQPGKTVFWEKIPDNAKKTLRRSTGSVTVVERCTTTPA
jgi:hypothetical protein